MILITGATGTVGSAVLTRLSAQDVEVRAVTRDPRKAEATSSRTSSSSKAILRILSR
jgi:uncharacterized protein YbjT (DUF2867 family)